MAKTYRIVFLDLTEAEAQFMAGMHSQFGVDPARAKHIIENAPMVLKKGLTLGEAREYAEAVQRAGGKVHIQEHGESAEPEREPALRAIKSFGDFTLCPECGFTQLKAESCAKCGFVFLPEQKQAKGRVY
jgi:hypothetical protein